MSRFKKLTNVIWHCQYHIVWVPKYRFRVLTGAENAEVHNSIQVFCSQLECRVVEPNIQNDCVHLLIIHLLVIHLLVIHLLVIHLLVIHLLVIHLLVKVPPKVSISKLMGTMKGRTALRLFAKFSYLKKESYRGNHFWAKGCCVDTVGVDAQMIRKYVKYQEKKERLQQEVAFSPDVS